VVVAESGLGPPQKKKKKWQQKGSAPLGLPDRVKFSMQKKGKKKEKKSPPEKVAHMRRRKLTHF